MCQQGVYGSTASPSAVAAKRGGSGITSLGPRRLYKFGISGLTARAEVRHQLSHDAHDLFAASAVPTPLSQATVPVTATEDSRSDTASTHSSGEPLDNIAVSHAHLDSETLAVTAAAGNTSLALEQASRPRGRRRVHARECTNATSLQAPLRPYLSLDE